MIRIAADAVNHGTHLIDGMPAFRVEIQRDRQFSDGERIG